MQGQGGQTGAAMDYQKTEFSSMFGAFNLREGGDLLSFRLAFDAFCEHLKLKGYLHSWRLWERAYHDGYDTRFPDVSVIIEMCFLHHRASLDAWDYIESSSEPMKTLHREMNSRIRDAHFVLCNER
jgi:hypothetical protein